MIWKIAKVGSCSAVDFAAEEMKRCLRAMDAQADISIMAFPTHDKALTDVLWLGVCPEIAGSVEDPELDDAYRVDIVRGCGAIRGSNGRSVLFGVYHFLKKLGCSWVRPGTDGEYLPEGADTGIEIHLDEKASYRHRGICIEGAVGYQHVSDMIDWMPKMGYNAYFNQFNNPVTFYNRWYEHQANPLLEGKTLSGQEIAALRDQSVIEMKRRGLLYHAAGHGWTCEPFGIPGERWEPREYDIPASSIKYLAKVNGKRGLWHNVPLNTNLCYSNPVVRRKIANAIADHCYETPEIDYVQVWLADGKNNHCECSKCKKMRPSDWYITLLNEIDETLTRRNIKTKVVFLLYVDLLWEPQQVKLKNQDRFVMMFAPITRTYSTTIADAPEFDEEKLPEFELNRLQFPESVGENLAWMRRWRRHIQGDGFAFDYHYMWDHFCDPGYYEMARILFRDMQSLHSVGLNGMVSCQNQRVFFPTGLGMTAMAAALWNEKADFETVAKDYFAAAYGTDGETVRSYMQELSAAVDPVYIRGEKGAVSPENAAKLAMVPQILERYLPLICQRMNDPALPDSFRASWRYLHHHSRLCALYALMFQRKAEGRIEEAKAIKVDAMSYARQHEMELHHVLDVRGFQESVNRYFLKNLT